MAVKYDDRTLKGWPVPHKANKLIDDVERLRDTLCIIDKNITDVENHEVSIENRQDFLDIRMDTIAGQATEDTEILDARVAPDGYVYPNLGHHLRDVHIALRSTIEDLSGLLRQFNE